MAADFTGDGKVDIAGRADHTGDWWIATSTGSSFTNARWTRWSTNVDWVDVMAADFTGDGRDDLVGRVAANGDWWVAESAGSSFVNRKWTRWSANVNWVDVMVGDFTGDGRDDLVGRVAANGDWWVSTSNGTSTFLNRRFGRWPAASVLLASTSSTEAASLASTTLPSAHASTMSMFTTSRWKAQLEVVADLLVPNTSTGLLHGRPFQAEDTSARPPGRMPALPGGAAIARSDLIDAFMRDTEDPPANWRAEHRLLQAVFPGRTSVPPQFRFNIDWDDNELPAWGALIEDFSLDPRGLDAYYAALVQVILAAA